MDTPQALPSRPSVVVRATSHPMQRQDAQAERAAAERAAAERAAAERAAAERAAAERAAAVPAHLQPALHAAVSTLQRALAARSAAAAPAAAAPAVALLSGAHGSGKRLLVRHVERALRRHHPTLLRVALHGALHAPPQRAWRRVAAQLHNAAAAAAANNNNNNNNNVPVDRCLALIARRLHRLRRHRRPVLLVLHHVHAFASSSHPAAQPVLYSLLNWLHDPHLRAACIATTSAVDLTDALEKRVKSRFAHRHIVLPLPQHAAHILPSLAHTLIPTPNSKPPKSRHQFIRAFLDHPRCTALINARLARNRAPIPILSALHLSLSSFLANNRLPPHRLTPKRLNTLLQSALHHLHTTLFPPPPHKHILQTLSALEIALLVALRKLQHPHTPAHHSTRNLTFDHAFHTYSTMSTTPNAILRHTSDAEPTLPKPVAEKAWEKLVESGLIVRVGTAPRHLRPCHLAVHPTAVDHAIQQHTLVSTAVKRWANTQT